MSATTAVLVLLAGGLLTWLLRVLLIAVLPADRLPDRIRASLPHVGPAVLGALIVSTVVHGAGVAALLVPNPTTVALLAAGIVAWRVRSLAAPMAVALAVMLAAGLLPT